MENLIYDYIQVEFNHNDSSYFGYVEKNNIVIFVYAVNKKINNVNKIQKIIVEKIIERFLVYPFYGIDYTKNMLKYIENILKVFEEYIEELSIMIVLTDLNTYLIASLGNISFIHFNKENKEEIFNIDKLDISDKNEFKLIGLKKLNVNDNIDISYENYINSTINISKIKQVETADKINKIGLKQFAIIFIFLFSIIYIICNISIIKNYEKKVDKHSKNLNYYISILDEKNISLEVFQLEEIYKKIHNNKFIILSRKKAKKYSENELYIKNIKTEIDELRKQKDRLKEAKIYADNNEFEKSLEILQNMKYVSLKYIDIENLKSDIDVNIKKAKELQENIENMINADEDFLNKKYYIALKKYENIKKIYAKYYKSSYNYNEIDAKISESKLALEKVNDEITLMLLDVEKYMEVDYLKVKDIYFDIIVKYEQIDDIKSIETIKAKIELLENNINFENARAYSLREEARLYAKNSRYRIAIDCLIESNNIFKKTRLKNEINKNNVLIRQYKSKLNENYISSKEVKNNKNKVNNTNNTSIIDSINLSIKKGDEFMKENMWNDAIIEYQRAIDFAEKVEISRDKKEKLKRKLSFAIKKNNDRWWNKWK